MWSLKRIYAQNFMTFDKVEFDFEKKCYLVQGKNEDNNTQSSNGSGKTSLVDVIAVILLGDSLTGRSLKDTCNWALEADFFTVRGELENKEHNLTCEIERKIYSKNKSGELTILINGKAPNIPTKQGLKNGVDVKAGNEYILKEILDIKKQDVLNYFLISKNSYQPFLQVNTDKKLEVIGRFTNTLAVDKTISKLETEIEQDEDGIQEYNDKIKHAEGFIEALRSSLNEEAELAYEEKKMAEIEAIEVKINAIINETEKSYKESNVIAQNIFFLEESCTTIDEVEKIKLKKEYDSIDSNELLELRNELNKEIQVAKNYLSGLIECPKCNHKFHLTSEVEYTEEGLKEFEENLIVVNEEIENNSQLRLAIKEKIAVIETEERDNRQLKSEISSLERNVTSLVKQQERLLKELEKLEFDKNNIAAKTFADEKADVGYKILEKESDIKSLTIQLQELKDTLDKKKKWVDLFADFKFYLGNKPLNLITGLVNNYLQLNGSDLNLHIEGFKKIRSGEIRQALNPIIFRNWQNPKDYNSFSEGEKARLNIATDLAFQQLINSASKTGGLSLYINDELLAGVDSEGIYNAANAFNNIDKTILLVTHSAESLNFKNTIVVEKKNGISKIINGN